MKTVETIKRELRARGKDLAAFCAKNAVTETAVVRYLNGTGRLHESVIHELAESLGIAERHLALIAA